MNWLALVLTVPTAILLWVGMLILTCIGFLLGAYGILIAILGTT